MIHYTLIFLCKHLPLSLQPRLLVCDQPSCWSFLFSITKQFIDREDDLVKDVKCPFTPLSYVDAIEF
jgi:hypothetical protein